VFTRQAPPTGFATFMMWALLDCLLLINTIRNGQPIWLPFGWVVGATVTSIALGIRGTWHWTRRETFSLACATIAATVSVLMSGRGGLVASVIAMIAAGMPILIDNLTRPVKATFMLWLVTVISCVISLLGSDWSFDGTVLQWSSLTYNVLMAAIVIRKPKTAAIATA